MAGIRINRSGNGSTANSAFVSGAACPTEVHGNETLSSIGGCANLTSGTSAACATASSTWTAGRTFLKSAIEIINDSLGDDDGLCESSEACLYTPNFGVYQGHGALAQCTFVDDSDTTTIQNVTMYGYANNGR
ncbi:MAG: hypothetical protein AAB425_13870 [Bdellovibrionota bacterium]